MAANPQATSQLGLDEEAKKIRQGLERSKWRDRFEIFTRWAVDPDELRRALLDIEPHIVHFSGHGTGAGGLVLHPEEGKAKLASGAALANLFELFSGQIECVLLNACYSEGQAAAIHQHVDYVIGMTQAVGDRAAIKFAVGFYDALGAGRPYGKAYKFGCSAIDFEDVVQRMTPVLLARGAAGETGTGPETGPETETRPEKPSGEGVDTRKVTVVSETVAPEAVEKDASAASSQSGGQADEQTTGAQATGKLLETPEGQVPLSSPFYMERLPIETDCYGEIVRPGALIRIKAARQMGKSSLMTRILTCGEQQGYCSVPIFFQEADGEVFDDLAKFLRWFCATIAEELDLDIDIDALWKSSSLGNKRKCTNFFQKHLLPQIKTPLVLGLDEVDLVFQHLKIAQDFFALLRTWHERGKNQATWQNLRLVIVHSREVYIPLDMHQSPFNVGMPVELREFNAVQVTELAERHGLSLSTKDVKALQAMVGGHPYLVRVALYELARGRVSLAELLKVAPTEAGPYEDHLRRHLADVRSDAALMQALKTLLASDKPVKIAANEAFQLDSKGLVRLEGNAAAPLCDLYRQYFRERL
ncbi:MAG: AAA-like domain-containing protein [Cyanobacteria bacterium P01_D01_bin.105]